MQRASLPIFGVGSFYILARKLSEHDMGQWALFIAITASLEGAKNGLIKNAMVHYLNAREDNEHVQIKSASLVLNVLVTLVFGLLILCFAGPIGTLFEAGDLPSMLQLYALIMIGLIPFSHFMFIQQAKVSYLGILLGSVTRQGLFFFFLLAQVLLFHSELSLIELVFVQLVGVLLGTMVSFAYTRKFLDLKFQFERNWLGKSWAFGRYGMFTNISVSIITSTDHMMLGGMISTATVGVYSVAVKITNFFNLPAVALSGVLLPQGVKTATGKDPGQLKALFEKAVAATLAALTPLVLIALLFPKEIIVIIASEKYAAAAEILMVIIFTTLIMPFFQNYGMLVNAMGKPMLDFLFVLSISALNIVANYFMIDALGIIGAAYASLLTHIAGLIFIIITLRKMVGTELRMIGVYWIQAYGRLYNVAKSRIFNRG